MANEKDGASKKAVPPKDGKLSDEYFQGEFNTKLTPEEYLAYMVWARSIGKDPVAETADYDLQGYWKDTQGKVSENGRGHYPDTYKKPNHPTFSDQSQYSGVDSGLGYTYQGGTWAEDGSTYTPSQEMLDHTHPVAWLQAYMGKAEPNTKLVLPPDAAKKLNQLLGIE